MGAVHHASAPAGGEVRPCRGREGDGPGSPPPRPRSVTVADQKRRRHCGGGGCRLDARHKIMEILKYTGKMEIRWYTSETVTPSCASAGVGGRAPATVLERRPLPAPSMPEPRPPRRNPPRAAVTERTKRLPSLTTGSYTVPALKRDTGGVRRWAKKRGKRTRARGEGTRGWMECKARPISTSAQWGAGHDGTAQWRAPTG